MVLKVNAQAGTFDPGDATVGVGPGEGRVISIESTTGELFEEAIRAAVMRVLDTMDVSDVYVIVHDHGALDYVIEARTETALLRAAVHEKEGQSWN